MAKLDRFMTETQQTDIQTLLAEIEAEERDDGGPESGGDGDGSRYVCEFEPLCQQALEEKRKPGADPPRYPHRCGWLATNIAWCLKRRKWLEEAA